jgi:hypothetical protein
MKFQEEIKGFYWQFDHPKNTPAALNALIRDSAKFSLAAYILKFTSITDALVAKNVMSSVEWINKLLEGLDERMRIKVIELCTSKGWRITDQDRGGEPKFSEIAKYLEDKAKSGERVSVYDREHTMRGSLGPSSAISHTSTAVNSPKPTPIDPAVKELTDQLAALALIVKGMTSDKQGTTSTPAASTVPAAPAAPPRPEQIPRCIWCDSRDHFRRSEYTLFGEAMKAGHIKINENNRIALTATNAEIPPAFGRGGMKMMYNLVHPPTSATSSQGNVRTITFDDGVRELGRDARSVSVKEKGEWIEADVEDKRKREDGRFQRNAQRKIDGVWQDVTDPSQPAPGGTGQTPAAPASTGQSPAAPASTSAPASQTQPQPNDSGPRTRDVDSEVAKPKYRLQSELGKTISITDVGEKIMNAPIQLSIKEFLAVLPEMSGYIHEQTRRKRVPRDDVDSNTSINEIDVGVNTTSVMPGGKAFRPFYAIPSGRTLVVLDDKVRTECLLDDGNQLED